jgi:HSP20 family protein
MTRLSLYDPFSEVFPELFRGVIAPQRAGTGAQAVEIRVDVRESAGDYVVSAEMPGVTRDDIQVQIDGNRVAISAEVRREAVHKEGERVLRSERFYGTMSRSFSVAADIDDAAASARYENGVLTLTLPKKAVPGARKLTIN